MNYFNFCIINVVNFSGSLNWSHTFYNDFRSTSLFELRDLSDNGLSRGILQLSYFSKKKMHVKTTQGRNFLFLSDRIHKYLSILLFVCNLTPESIYCHKMSGNRSLHFHMVPLFQHAVLSSRIGEISRHPHL